MFSVLFIADIKMKWNQFRRACVPDVNSKTIVTVDPHTPDAECLSVYARAAHLQGTEIIDHLASNIVDST